MKNYHIGCVDSGWDFETDGKEFYCLLHRGMREKRSNDDDDPDFSPSSSMTGIPKSTSVRVKSNSTTNGTHLTQVLQVDKVRSSGNDKVMKHKNAALEEFQKKYPLIPLRCFLCNTVQSHGEGILIPHVQDGRQALVHQNCQRYTNIVNKSGAIGFNLFNAIRASKSCIQCKRGGATIKCNIPSCEEHYHFSCATSTGWNFASVGALFLCPTHGHRANSRSSNSATQNHSKDTSVQEPTPKHNGSVMNGNKHCAYDDLSGDTSGNPQSKLSEPLDFTEVTTATVGVHLSEARVTKMDGNDHPPSPVLPNTRDMIEAPSAEAPKTPLENSIGSKFVHDLFQQGANTCNVDQNSNTKVKKRKRNYGPSNEFSFRSLDDKVEETIMREPKHDPIIREVIITETGTSTNLEVNQVEGNNTNESTNDSILKTGKEGENISMSRPEAEPPVPSHEPEVEDVTMEESVSQHREPPVDGHRSEQSEGHDDDGQAGESVAEEQEVITIDDSSVEDSGEEWVNNPSEMNTDSDSEDGLSMFV